MMLFQRDAFSTGAHKKSAKSLFCKYPAPKELLSMKHLKKSTENML
jgi:hypothetical protein